MANRLASRHMNAVPTPHKKQYIHGQIVQINGCACSASAPFGTASYRAIHASLQHPSNFLPIAILEPHRLRGATPAKQCALWGLSMFESPQALTSMVARVERSVKNFRKKIGDHCAEMPLTGDHGTRTHANKDGHFDFYAYTTCSYEAQVVSVTQF